MGLIKHRDYPSQYLIAFLLPVLKKNILKELEEDLGPWTLS